MGDPVASFTALHFIEFTIVYHGPINEEVNYLYDFLD
jgi:hypothetical protein